jgi:hypothetical protein
MLEADDPRDGDVVGAFCEGTVLELIPELVELDVPAVIVVLGAACDGLDAVETDPLVFEVVGMDADPDMFVVTLVLELLPDGLVFERVVEEVLMEVCPEMLVGLKPPLCDMTTLFCELPPVVLPPELTAVVIEPDIPLWETEVEAVCNDELLEFGIMVCKDELVLGSDMRPLDPVPVDMEAVVVVCAVLLAEICVEPRVELGAPVKVGFEEKERLGDKFPPEIVCDRVENNDPEVNPDIMPVMLKIPVCEATVEVVCDVAPPRFVLEELKDVVPLCDAELEYVCDDPVVGLAIEELDLAI